VRPGMLSIERTSPLDRTRAIGTRSRTRDGGDLGPGSDAQGRGLELLGARVRATL
jgi:hypothetical protein